MENHTDYLCESTSPGPRRISRPRAEIKAIEVQMADSDAMVRSIKSGKCIRLDNFGLLSKGTATNLMGEETLCMTQSLADEFVVVDIDAVCASIKEIFEDSRCILEAPGAMCVAAMNQIHRKARRHEAGFGGHPRITVSSSSRHRR